MSEIIESFVRFTPFDFLQLFWSNIIVLYICFPFVGRIPGSGGEKRRKRMDRSGFKRIKKGIPNRIKNNA